VLYDSIAQRRRRRQLCEKVADALLLRILVELILKDAQLHRELAY
jgi:hypothetical protein